MKEEKKKKAQTEIKPHHHELWYIIKMEGNYMQMLQIENVEYLCTDDF